MLVVPSPSPRRAAVLTVLNLKGGVGKTHASWLLASVAQERGLRVLLIDTDPQGNLSNSFARDAAMSRAWRSSSIPRASRMPWA